MFVYKSAGFMKISKQFTWNDIDKQVKFNDIKCWNSETNSIYDIIRIKLHEIKIGEEEEKKEEEKKNQTI